MNKLVAALSLTTALFVASTLYLAYKLYGGTSDASLAGSKAAQAAPADLSHPVGAGVATSRTSSGPASLPGIQAGATNVVAALPAGGKISVASSSDAQRAAMLPFAKQFLARYDDPAQRATLLEETRNNLRRQYEPLKQKLKLDSNTFEQLLGVLAEQQLQPQEKYYRCLANPECNLASLGRDGNMVDDRSGELLSLLGSDNLNELNSYKNSISERETVTQLRGRLDDSNALRDAQAEQLVTALTEERGRYVKETAQRGANVSAWGTPQLGMLYFSGDSDSVEQRITEATQYSQRLRNRAAAVLSPQQLAAFVQIQDELLAMMRTSMLPPG